jgi:GMP reductase
MNDIKLDFDDVLIKPRKSIVPLTRKSVNIEIPWLDKTAHPVVIANMPSTGTYEIAKHMTPMKVFTFIHKEYKVHEHRENLAMMEDRSYIGITSGVRDKDVMRTIEIISGFEDIGMINVDIANVYANVDGMIKAIKTFKEYFPNILLCAGNICDKDLMEELVNAGADYIKVGVGSGSACITRTEVGVGVPQFSVIRECYEEAQNLFSCKIISDGGCVTAGDVCKAIAAGADMVMIAGMVSSCYECSNMVEIDGQQYVNLYGLGSTKQYNIHTISEQEYRPNEGRDLMIPAKGYIKDIINQILGGLRSVCTYVGVANIEELSIHAEFIRVNNTHNRSLEKYG